MATKADEDILGINDDDVRSLVPVSPLAMLDKALQRNLDPDTLEKLLQVYERWEANEARKAFVEAITRFKANPPTINKNKHVAFGQTEYDHATLDHVVDQITKGLSEHGISHRWEARQTEREIEVTCVLTHKAGHSERTTLKGPADTSGSKNAIQAIASAVTYLERYTLLAATGLAAKNGDNDGSGGPKLNNISERLEWIANCRTMDELQRVFAEAYKAARTINDIAGMKALIDAKDRRKRDLA